MAFGNAVKGGIWMAKIKGKPKQEITYSKDEIKKIVRQANQRLRRLEQSGISSKSLAYKRRSGERFRIKGKTDEELQNLVKEARGFLLAKSSRVKGAKEVYEASKNMLEKQGIYLDTQEQEDEFWNLYNKFQELMGDKLGKDVSTQLKSLVYDTMEYQRNKYGYVDEKRVFRNLKQRIKRMEEEENEEEESDFSRLTHRIQSRRTRNSRSR